MVHFSVYSTPLGYPCVQSTLGPVTHEPYSVSTKLHHPPHLKHDLALGVISDSVLNS